MAITQTALTVGGSTNDQSSYTTASISPTANRLIIVAVTVNSGGGATSVTGNGITYTKIADVTYVASDSYHSLWRGMSASPTTGAITINTSGTADLIVWSVTEFGNVDQSGTNGSGAVVQSATNSGTGTGLTVTLSAFGSANNATYGTSGFKRNVQTAVSCTPGSGFTEIHDTYLDDPVFSFQNALQSEWRVDNDTTVDFTWSETPQGVGGIAIEIKEAQQSAAGDINTSATVTGNGAARVNSGGLITATSSLAVAGSAVNTGIGDISASASLSGTGESQHGADASIAAQASIAGIGESSADSDGLISATALPDATGASVTIGDGEITAQALLTSAGESQHDADASIAAQASIAGIGESSADVDGLISSTAIVTAVGSVGGVEEGAGTIASLASIQAVGESTADVDGMVESTGLLTGESLEETVAEVPSIGAGAGSGGWTRQALRRKRKEQEWLEKIRREDEELFRLIQLSLPQAIAECVKRQIY